MRFSNSFLDEIRDRVPISTVIGRRVTWDRRKTNAARGDFWACCPFHGEKTPSFHVNGEKGFFHCFGCGVGGDVIKFVELHDKVTFPEAVRQLAAELGPTPLIGFAGAPFTLASYLVEGGPSKNHEHTKALMYGRPALWDRLMERLADITSTFLSVQVAAGAQVVQLFDS